MWKTFRLTCLLLCVSCYAQEISLLPGDQRTVPDQVVYRILMHHAAAFSQKAQELEARGLDGSPYRKHFEQKLGLTPDQVRTLMQVATDYCSQTQIHEEQVRILVKQFRDEHFQDGKLRIGEPLPKPPSGLETVRSSLDIATLAARDRLRGALGDVDFGRLDSAVREAFHAPHREGATTQ